jgi:hypothetical protein
MSEFVFTKPYKSWSTGDRVEPHQVLAPNETRALRENGTIVPADSREARKAMAPRPVSPKPPKVESETKTLPKTAGTAYTATAAPKKKEP